MSSFLDIRTPLVHFVLRGASKPRHFVPKTAKTSAGAGFRFVGSRFQLVGRALQLTGRMLPLNG